MNLKFAGFLYFFSGAIVLIGIITAEAFYPSGYSTFKNEISDLGATRQPNSVSFEPSSTIFNNIMLLAGIMVLVASFFQHKYFRKFLFSIPAILFGFGLVGVGILPGNKSPYHGMAAILTFLSGGFFTIASFKIITIPFTNISILFGSVALLTWFIAVFASATLISFIGIGGIRKALTISAGTLQNLRVSGKLKPAKIGGILFYRNSDLEKLLDSGNQNLKGE